MTLIYIYNYFNCFVKGYLIYTFIIQEFFADFTFFVRNKLRDHGARIRFKTGISLTWTFENLKF